MARLGEIVLGGHGIVGQLGEPIVSAAAFNLSEPSPLDYAYVPFGQRWEIELRDGQSTIVARTPEHLDRSTLLANGLEQAQRTLDLISFERRYNILIQAVGDRHTLLFRRGDQLVLQYAEVTSLGISFSAQVVVKDQDGKVIPPNPPPSPAWTTGLRFYRMSQASQDLYEAYRNLFLGLEALLEAVCPKQPVERERDWLLRAVRAVGTLIHLRQFAPSNCTDPPAYIVGTQYDYIRCRLFHAKLAAGDIPLDMPDPEEVASAYERLLRIWRQIAQDCLSVRGGGDGAMTYIGFRMMMDNALSRSLTMYFTEDPSPARKDDQEVSPLGKEVFAFKDVRYLGETAPGRVPFVGTHQIGETPRLPPIHRICSKIQDSLLTTGGIKEGIQLEAVDYFESLQTIRMVNRDLPKVVFSLGPA